MIRPPENRMGRITPRERGKFIKSSPVHGRSDETVDRAPVYEKLVQH